MNAFESAAFGNTGKEVQWHADNAEAQKHCKDAAAAGSFQKALKTDDFLVIVH